MPKPPKFARPARYDDPEGWERQTPAEIDASITGRPIKAILKNAREDLFSRSFTIVQRLDGDDFLLEVRPGYRLSVVHIAGDGQGQGANNSALIGDPSRAAVEPSGGGIRMSGIDAVDGSSPARECHRSGRC